MSKPNSNVIEQGETMNDIRVDPLSDGKVSPLTKDGSWDRLANYEFKLPGVQAYHVPRRTGDQKHHGADFGSNAGVKKGTEVSALLSGTATVTGYTKYPGNKELDYAVIVKGVNPKGESVEVTYGHLTRESVEKLFNVKPIKGNESKSITAGTVVGQVSENSTGNSIKNGKIFANNEPHTHLKVIVNGKEKDPRKFITELTPYYRKQSSAVMGNNDVIPKLYTENGNSTNSITNTNNYQELHLLNQQLYNTARERNTGDPIKDDMLAAINLISFGDIGIQAFLQESPTVKDMKQQGKTASEIDNYTNGTFESAKKSQDIQSQPVSKAVELQR